MHRIRWIVGFLLPVGACQAPSASVGDGNGWTVELKPVVEIGSRAGAKGHDLYNVRAAMRFSDGGLAIADEGSSELRFYDADGHLTSAVGSEPGVNHIRRIQTARRGIADTILVRSLDPAIVRISVNEQQVVGRIEVPIPPVEVTCRSAGEFLMPTGNLLILAHESRTASCAEPTVGRIQTTDLLARFDLGDGVLDTIAVLPGLEQTDRWWVGFPRALIIAVSKDRIYAAESGSDSIWVFDAKGSPEAVWHVALERAGVTEAARDGARRRGRVVYDIPEEYPRFAQLVPDEAGNLWVMAYPRLDKPVNHWVFQNGPPLKVPIAEEGADWLVLDSNGQETTRVRTPSGLHVLEIGEDYVLGVAQNWKNEEVVRLYHLVK